MRRRWAGPRRYTRRAPRVSPARRAVYALVWTALLAGGALLAPVADDLRSDLRTMEAGCRILRVIDGDTLDIACAGGPAVRARLTGYDAPELHSPHCAAEAQAAAEARDALARIAARRPIEAAFLGSDKYDRALVDLRAGGVRVAAAMVSEGHGRRYLGGLRGGWC